MQDKSTASPAPPSTPKEVLADRIEAELDRLRVARPHLEARIARATNILLLQLSSPPRSRPIRCRIGAMGPRFLVASGTSRGAVYTVNPKVWACSCPDVHRTGKKGCKHALAAFVLWRLAAAKDRPCACIDGWVFVGHTELVHEDTGEVVESFDRIPCRRCGGPSERS